MKLFTIFLIVVTSFTNGYITAYTLWHEKEPPQGEEVSCPQGFITSVDTIPSSGSSTNFGGAAGGAASDGYMIGNGPQLPSGFSGVSSNDSMIKTGTGGNTDRKAFYTSNIPKK